MCLTSIDKMVHIATADIPVVKHLNVTSKGVYSPYQKMQVGKCPFVLKGEVIEPELPTSMLELSKAVEAGEPVGYGMIHAYTEDAEASRVNILCECPEGFSGEYPFDAIIPKGAVYVVGKDGEVAANVIIIADVPWKTILVDQMKYCLYRVSSFIEYLQEKLFKKQ